LYFITSDHSLGSNTHYLIVSYLSIFQIIIFPSRNPIAICLFLGLIDIALAQNIGLYLLNVEAVDFIFSIGSFE